LRRTNEFKPDSLLSYLFYVLDIRESQKDIASNVIAIDCEGGALQNIHQVRDKLIAEGRKATVSFLKTRQDVPFRHDLHRENRNP